VTTHSLRARLTEVVVETRRLGAGRKPSADHLRELIDALPFAALVADNTGRFVITNTAALKLTGYTARELQSLSFWDLTPPSREHEGERLWRAFLQLSEQTGEYPLVRKDGRVVKTSYAAKTHVLPGLHLSLLNPSNVSNSLAKPKVAVGAR
jgi:PAS domain S-box-containing protein